MAKISYDDDMWKPSTALVPVYDSVRDEKEIQRILLNALFTYKGDLIDGNVKARKGYVDKYLEALEILEELESQGKLMYEASRIDMSYECHTVDISWCHDPDDDCLVLDGHTRELATELTSKFDTWTVQDDDGFEWLLYSHIFVPA